jgi:hypothetical protein
MIKKIIPVMLMLMCVVGVAAAYPMEHDKCVKPDKRRPK